MNTIVETTTVHWSVTDEQFFRVAAELFTPTFLRGAGVLLASYDPEPSRSDAAVALTDLGTPQSAPAPSPVTA